MNLGTVDRPRTDGGRVLQYHACSLGVQSKVFKIVRGLGGLGSYSAESVCIYTMGVVRGTLITKRMVVESGKGSRHQIMVKHGFGSIPFFTSAAQTFWLLL